MLASEQVITASTRIFPSSSFPRDKSSKFHIPISEFQPRIKEWDCEEARLLAGKKQTNTQAINNSRKTLNLGCMRLSLYLTMRSRSRWEAVMIITGRCLAKVLTFKADIYLKLIDDTTYLSPVLSSVSFKSCYFRLNRTMKILHFTIQVVRLKQQKNIGSRTLGVVFVLKF